MTFSLSLFSGSFSYILINKNVVKYFIRPRAILDIIKSGESFRIATSTKMPEQGTCERCGYISSQVSCTSSCQSLTSNFCMLLRKLCSHHELICESLVSFLVFLVISPNFLSFPLKYPSLFQPFGLGLIFVSDSQAVTFISAISLLRSICLFATCLHEGKGS